MSTDARTQTDRRFLERTLALAQEGLTAGSSPIGCVIVDAEGQVVSEGRNHSGEPWPSLPHRVADSSFAHAEMDAFFRLENVHMGDAAGWTLYSSLEPCLMCGGAVGMVGMGRVVWACDDPWGGSGRLIAWNEHPAYEKIEVGACPFPDLETESAELFAVEAMRVYPPEGWERWKGRYPEVCARVETFLAEVPEQSRNTHGPPPTHPDPPTLD